MHGAARLINQGGTLLNPLHAGINPG
jgi:hypothetical protein